MQAKEQAIGGQAAQAKFLHALVFLTTPLNLKQMAT
jgi:hypothetical protein